MGNAKPHKNLDISCFWMRKIKFIVEDKQITAEFIDKNPKTANAVWDALPLQSRINTWGDEIYFGTTVNSASYGIFEENS